MFTGLVEQIGSVVSNNKVDFGIRLSISCDAFDEMPKNGDSIAISGCCLTLVDSERVDNATILLFDVIEETLYTWLHCYDSVLLTWDGISFTC